MINISNFQFIQDTDSIALLQKSLENLGDRRKLYNNIICTL